MFYNFLLFRLSLQYRSTNVSTVVVVQRAPYSRLYSAFFGSGTRIGRYHKLWAATPIWIKINVAPMEFSLLLCTFIPVASPSQPMTATWIVRDINVMQTKIIAIKECAVESFMFNVLEFPLKPLFFCVSTTNKCNAIYIHYMSVKRFASANFLFSDLTICTSAISVAFNGPLNMKYNRPFFLYNKVKKPEQTRWRVPRERATLKLNHPWAE